MAQYTTNETARYMKRKQYLGVAVHNAYDVILKTAHQGCLQLKRLVTISYY